jgi:hypothetical protein
MPHGSVSNKGLKKVGLGHVYYRGSESKHDLQSVDADLVALDEYDNLSPGNIPDAERRISGSQLALIRRVGVPTTPEWGIARHYAHSDRRRWFVECEACGEWQHLDFWKNVKITLRRPPRGARARCASAITVRSRSTCRRASGSRSSRRATCRLPRVAADRAALRHADDCARRAGEGRARRSRCSSQKDLGLPLSNTTGGLDRETIAAAISAAEARYGDGRPGSVPQMRGYNGTNLVTMGVDVAGARNLNVRISEHLDSLYERGHRKRALWIGEARASTTSWTS